MKSEGQKVSTLGSTIIFLGAAVVAVPIFKKLKLGAILGYLVAGALIGPSVFNLVSDPDTILHFAELGVVLLLFLIGIELEPEKLWQLRGAVLVTGGGQLVISAGLIGALLYYVLGDWPVALVIGLAVALSSTAFAIQLMEEHRLLRSPPGQRGFGILLMQSGSEIGDAKTVAVGTKARINDWYQGSDGILGITALGTERFRLSSCSRQDDGLYVGSVCALEPEQKQCVPDDYRSMGALLEVIISDLGKLYENIETRYDDATWVGYRFAEILPISLEQKQHCLEIDDAIDRLIFLRPLLRSIRKETPQ